MKNTAKSNKSETQTTPISDKTNSSFNKENRSQDKDKKEAFPNIEAETKSKNQDSKKEKSTFKK